MKTLSLLTILLLLLLSGCATVVNGPKQLVQFQSEPEGALIKVNNLPMGKTPFAVEMPRDEFYDIAIEKEGFLPFNTKIKPRFNPWVLGNLVFGFVPGYVVDSFSGADTTLNQDKVLANLQPLNADTTVASSNATN